MKLKKNCVEHAVVAFLVVPTVAVSLTGCNTAGCTDNRNSLPLAGFYGYPSLERISLDSVAVGGVGAPGDSLLNEPGKATSTVYLPLRATRQSTSFYLRYLNKALDHPSLTDTITLGYDAEPQFVSEECGAMYIYHITEMRHTSHLIDSVSVTDSTITNLDIERIQIFFRVSQTDPDEQ